MLATPQRLHANNEHFQSYSNPNPAMFHRRNERIDWRRMAAVDVDRIARELDFQALQENLEQITFCNIDSEVDSRMTDPNFIKLYKMAQLTIEYLLTCQEQLSNQLVENDQLKNRVLHDENSMREEIQKLRDEIATNKQELKKRRKMLETQQRLLHAQAHNYHPCPECSRVFLNGEYLKKHMETRHKGYVPPPPSEKDVETKREMQHLKDELKKKESELQALRTQKAVDDEKIRGFEASQRQWKEEKHHLNTEIKVLTDRVNTARPNISTQPNDREVADLLRENQRLKSELDEQKDLRHQSDKNLKRLERENQKLKEENSDLQKRLDILQRSSGDAAKQNSELAALQEELRREKQKRKDAEEQPRPSSVISEVKPTTPKQPKDQSPVQMRPARPVTTNELLLPQHCPTLTRRLTENPKYLAKHRDGAKKEFLEELETAEDLGILEGDTRLSDLDYRTKMEKVLKVRRTIQNDLPNFEKVRRELAETLDRLVQDRAEVRRSDTSIRSGGSKLVTFKDEKRRTWTSSDDDIDDSRPVPPTDLRPSPRKNLPNPSSGISALVAGATKTDQNKDSTIARLPAVKPMQRVTHFQSDSDDESHSSPRKTPVAPTSSALDKTKIIQKKLDEANAKVQKPTVGAIAQAFRPSLMNTNRTENDEEPFDDDESLTTLHTANGKRPSIDQQPQAALRQLINKNPLSSGEMSQYTYDSLLKSNGANGGGRGHELRRPATADSAKTSNMDSDDNLEDDVST